MEIIDAQLHEPVAWLDWDESDDATKQRVETEILLAWMDAAGVDAAVVDCGNAGLRRFASRAFPERIAHVESTFYASEHTIDPERPDLADEIAKVRGEYGALGIRMMISPRPGQHFETQDKFEAGLYETFFALCEQHEIPLFVFVTGDPDIAARIARAHPDLALIVDHIGIAQPPLSTPETPPFKRLPEVLALAQYPNIALKFSGTPALSGESYPFAGVWPSLLQLVEAFGPERLMWGTDIYRIQHRIGGIPGAEGRHYTYPGKHTYAEAVLFFRESTELSQSDKEQMFAGTARRLLRWPAT